MNIDLCREPKYSQFAKVKGLINQLTVWIVSEGDNSHPRKIFIETIIVR